MNFGKGKSNRLERDGERDIEDLSKEFTFELHVELRREF